MFGKRALTSLLFTFGAALLCAPAAVQAHPMSRYHPWRRQDGNETSTSGNSTQLKYSTPKLCDPDVKQVRVVVVVVVLRDKQTQTYLKSFIVFRLPGCCQ